MAVNSIGDFIKSVFSPMINKNSVIFRALFADDDESGTVEKSFKELELARKNWEVEGTNLYNQRGEQLEKSLALFSVLERLNSDTDVSILARFALLFQRNGDTVWGDKWDILKIFKTIFKTEDIWIENNTEPFSENLLGNGDFSADGIWSVSGNATYDEEARIEGIMGMNLNGGGKCSQSVELKAGKTYFLHFFIKGNMAVSVKNNAGKFWNPNNIEFGAWEDLPVFIPFQSSEWDCKNLYFITDENSTIEIAFNGTDEGYGFIDFIMLNEKTRGSSFSLIVLLESATTGIMANFAPGKNDPVEGVDYEKTSYFNSSFFYGTVGDQRLLYKEIMDIVKPGGVEATIEMLSVYKNQ